MARRPAAARTGRLRSGGDGPRALGEEEREQAALMIREGDNAAATALWDAIGGGEGLARANPRLGLEETSPGADGLWGLTETTASDQLRLLRAVFTDDPPLSPASRDNPGNSWAAEPRIGTGVFRPPHPVAAPGERTAGRPGAGPGSG